MDSYEEYVIKFDKKYDELIVITPSVESVNELKNEDDKLAFVKAFREIMRVKNILNGFSDFKWSDLKMSEQEFEDYKSKYLDMYEDLGKNKDDKEKVSILDDVDFELELIHKDEINVSYILELLVQFIDIEDEELKSKHKENISNILNNNSQLRSKKELIEKFINENLAHIADISLVDEEFEKFWGEQKTQAFDELCKEEDLNTNRVRKVVETYLYDERTPLANDIAKTLNTKPKLLERKKIVPRVLDKIMKFIDKFYEK